MIRIARETGAQRSSLLRSAIYEFVAITKYIAISIALSNACHIVFDL